MDRNVRKGIIISYTQGEIKELKENSVKCNIFISLDGVLKFADEVCFTKERALKLLQEHNSNGPLVVDFDEVFK